MTKSAETINVQIDPGQFAAQKKNNYSLFLAKKVNGVYTVIWQSKGAKATSGNPSYGPNDSFTVTTPSYEVNYTNTLPSKKGIKIRASGDPVTVNLGETVSLSDIGVFGKPTGSGAAGSITIDNQLQANPHEILNDSDGNPIFVNTQSGMDIGTATLTPIDRYQIWFANTQQTGTIIAANLGKVGEVVFDGKSQVETISYDASGNWVNAPLPS
jgi:hypothetical protein